MVSGLKGQRSGLTAIRLGSDSNECLLVVVVVQCKPLWCVMTPTDIKSQWRESWKSAPVINVHLVDDPTIRQPGFTLPRQQWSLLNRFHTGQGHCRACKKTWRLIDSDLCLCGENQTMSHIVKSCYFTKLNCGLPQLHSADDAAIAWLTNYGS